MSDTLSNLEQRLGVSKDTGSNVVVSPLKVTRQVSFKLTVGEMRAAIAKNPEHPIAAIYTKAIKGYADEVKLAVDRADLEALLTNGKVVIKTEQRYDTSIHELVSIESKVVIPPEAPSRPQRNDPHSAPPAWTPKPEEPSDE